MPILTLSRHEKYIHSFPFSLTEEGIVHAVATGKRLTNDYGDFDIVYCSPVLRAKQTALAHCQHSGITPVIDERLEENAGQLLVDEFKFSLAASMAEDVRHLHIVTHQPVINRFTDNMFFVLAGETLVYRLEKWEDLFTAKPCEKR